MTNIIQFPSDRIAKGTYTYYPEMKEQKPNTQIEANLSYNGKHYFIDTPLQLKGRGVNFIKTYTSNDLTSFGQRKAGWNSYQVTMNAYAKLEKEYSISNEVLLD